MWATIRQMSAGEELTLTMLKIHDWERTLIVWPRSGGENATLHTGNSRSRASCYAERDEVGSWR